MQKDRKELLVIQGQLKGMAKNSRSPVNLNQKIHHQHQHVGDTLRKLDIQGSETRVELSTEDENLKSFAQNEELSANSILKINEPLQSRSLNLLTKKRDPHSVSGAIQPPKATN